MRASIFSEIIPSDATVNIFGRQEEVPCSNSLQIEPSCYFFYAVTARTVLTQGVGLCFQSQALACGVLHFSKCPSMAGADICF